MTLRRFVIPVTVNSSGDATVYSPILSGRLISMRYVKNNFTDGVDFTITAEGSGETLWTESNVNASASRYPRGATASTAGAASLYAGGGTAVNNKIGIASDRVKIVVASGGNATAGTFHIIVDG